VLCGIDLDLDSDKSLAIMGQSGSGKSTFLHVLGGLDKPSAGKILLDGLDPLAMNETDLAHYRNQKVGFVFQDHHLLPQCTVLENVLLPSLLGSTPKVEVIQLAKDLLARVGLENRMDHMPSELSGGERQRAAVARALIMRPRLLLADEPTGNLDKRNADNIMRLLLKLHEEEKNILIVVTHSLELAKLFPRVMTMDDGILAQAVSSN
jgi:lipoprotein-releasing system ATP-binding protein